MTAICFNTSRWLLRHEDLPLSQPFELIPCLGIKLRGWQWKHWILAPSRPMLGTAKDCHGLTPASNLDHTAAYSLPTQMGWGRDLKEREKLVDWDRNNLIRQQTRKKNLKTTTTTIYVQSQWCMIQLLTNRWPIPSLSPSSVLFWSLWLEI